MAMEKSELQEWLNTLPDDAVIAVDDGGLTLVQVGTGGKTYCEVGGEPYVCLECDWPCDCTS